MNKEINFDCVFDSQNVFRKLLDAFSYPGKIINLSEFGIKPNFKNKAALLICLTLLDIETKFCVVSKNKEEKNYLEEYIKLNTNAKLTNLKEADFVIATDEIKDFENLKLANLLFPDESATVIYVIDKILQKINEKDKLFHKIKISGPGIKDDKEIHIKGISEEEILKMKNINSEFPLGIDFILTDENDNIVVIPRSVKINLE